MNYNSIPPCLTLEEIRRLSEYKLAYEASINSNELQALNRLRIFRAAVKAGYYNEG